MNREWVEKRRFIRADFACRIIIRAPEEMIINSRTENIGAGGVRVILDKKLNILSKAGLEIFLNGEPVKCDARVVWVVEKDSNFDTGIEFCGIDEEDEKVIDNLVKNIVS